MTSFSVIPPTPCVDDVHAHLGVLDLLRARETAASTEPSTSPLRTRLRSWTAPSCICEKSVSSETPRFGRCASCSRAQALAAHLRELARLALVLDDARELAGRRRLVEAEDLDRVARAAPP